MAWELGTGTFNIGTLVIRLWAGLAARVGGGGEG